MKKEDLGVFLRLWQLRVQLSELLKEKQVSYSTLARKQEEGRQAAPLQPTQPDNVSAVGAATEKRKPFAQKQLPVGHDFVIQMKTLSQMLRAVLT